MTAIIGRRHSHEIDLNIYPQRFSCGEDARFLQCWEVTFVEKTSCLDDGSGIYVVSYRRIQHGAFRKVRWIRAHLYGTTSVAS